MHISNSDMGNLLNTLSLIYAMENLQENREQSKQNDVQSANDKQAQYLLEQINAKFEEQKALLMLIFQKVEVLTREADRRRYEETHTQSNNT